MKITKEDIKKLMKKVRRDEQQEILPQIARKVHKNKKKYTRENKHKKKDV